MIYCYAVIASLYIDHTSSPSHLSRIQRVWLLTTTSSCEFLFPILTASQQLDTLYSAESGNQLFSFDCKQIK